jgi:hypothetical protein
MLQPNKSVIEICHVVRDMDAALLYWTKVMGAGPFFVGNFEWEKGVTYRGRAVGQSLQIAFGFSTGPGFHHVMLREDFDAGFKRLSDAGYEAAYHGALPGGERFVLFDTRKDSGGFVELMDISPLIQRQLENMARAHQEWDGRTDPIRPMASSFA